MKTTKRNFLKGLLSAIPLSKIIDIEGSENKEIAKKEQENINKFYRDGTNSLPMSGHYYTTGSYPITETGMDEFGNIYSGCFLPIEDKKRWENKI